MDRNMSFTSNGVGSPTAEPRKEYRSLFENMNGRRMFRPSTTSSSDLSKSSNLSNAMRSSNSSILTSSNSSSTLAQSLSSQQVLNAGSTSSSSSRLSQATSSQRVTSSSSSSTSQSTHSQIATSQMNNRAAIQRDLSEMKNSMNEINNLAANKTPNLQISEFKNRLRRSFENLVDDDTTNVALVTFPDENDDMVAVSDDKRLLRDADGKMEFSLKASDFPNDGNVKIEQMQKMMNSSKTKISTNNFSSEQETSNAAQMKRVQVGDIEIKEASAIAACRNRTEIDGLKTEAANAVLKEERLVKAGDYQRNDINNIEASQFKVQRDQFSAESRAVTQAQQSQTKTSTGLFNQEKIQHKSQVSYNHSSMITQSAQYSTSSTVSTNGADVLDNFEDLEKLNGLSHQRDVDQAIMKYSQHISSCIGQLNQGKSNVLDDLNQIIRRAWAVPTFGDKLGASLCNALKQNGGLDVIMKSCMDENKELQFSSARLLEQCLTTENRAHVVENGLDKVVNVACACTRNSQTDHSRVGTGILEHLFKHSEGTCSDVIKLGGLDAVLFECRKNDVETLRHCAGALANLSLYGGAENQEAMINRKVPMWLFPLAFHDDDNIKYYACLAIAVLVANKEIEAEVLKSGTLDLVEPFVTTHNPYEFAKSNLAHAHGQSEHWLQRLVPVLSSKREEARNLASFHFCMEAGIKKQQGKTEIFREIGAIEPLKKVASCPNAIASKFAAQALRLIGEAVPHKLSQQVPLWSVEDVGEWVKQIGFGEYEQKFQDSKVDGDLLLQLTDENLTVDLGMSNGIRRKRFERELQNLKKMADYSSRDPTSLNSFLSQIGPEFSIYTYSMLNAGVDKDSMRNLNDDQLFAECGINNSIHRKRILDIISGMQNTIGPTNENLLDKTLDVFVSYRRSNGSQLASLLKVHLQLRGFSVFIDVERLEAGKFDNNLLQSIKQAKHFLLVLTPRALERCLEDHDRKDWVHREIVAALNSNCNIIPIIDNFSWPEPEKLPEDMRSVCHFNGVRWIHDYQDACVDKLERFMRGELNIRTRGAFDLISTAPGTPGTASSIRTNPPNYQRMHSNDSNKGNEVKES